MLPLAVARRTATELQALAFPFFVQELEPYSSILPTFNTHVIITVRSVTKPNHESVSGFFNILCSRLFGVTILVMVLLQSPGVFLKGVLQRLQA